MNDIRLLEDFIWWLSEKGDVYYVFDNPHEVVLEYLNRNKSLQEEYQP